MIAAYHGKGRVSGLIKWFTRSDISHVAWIDDETGMVFEAWSSPFPGRVMRVANISVNHTPGTVVDLYDVTVTPEQLRLIRAAAESQVGKPYDWMGVLGFLTRPSKDLNWRLAWFCSEFLAWIFNEGGVYLFPGLEPFKIAPCQFTTNPIIRFNRRTVTV